jgi:DUF1365 family protein
VVRHRRSKPRSYQFTYGVYYVHLDLDELEEAARKIALLSYNGRNALSFRDTDHIGGSDGPLRERLRAYMEDRGFDPDGVRVSLLTNARVFGYVFNPVSFYFVRDRLTDGLLLVIAEVHNTHGEEHMYDLARDESTDVYRSAADKKLYVSPFIDMDGRYAFECRELAGGVYDLRIDQFRRNEGPDSQPFFQAQLLVKPVALTNANVVKMLVRYPFMTLRTIHLIHWQGLKLWVRGVKYLPHRPKEEAGA